MRIRRYRNTLLAFFTFILLASCAHNDVLDGEGMEVKKVFVVSDDEQLYVDDIRHFLRQMPGRVNGKKQHHVYSDSLTQLSCNDLAEAMHSKGYLQATARAVVHQKGGAEVTYIIHPGEPSCLRNVTYNIQDTQVDSLLTAGLAIHDRSLAHLYGSQIREGNVFSVEALNHERSLLTSFLQDNGFFRFNRDFIRFRADSVPGQRLIDLTLELLPYKANNSAAPGPHPYYTVRKVKYEPADNERVMLRRKVLDQTVSVKEGLPYSAADVQDTYRRFGRLQAVRYTNIRFDEIADSLSDAQRELDCIVQLATAKSNTISFQPEGTNTAGNLGAAASLTYENRNLFHGSEVLSLQLRGAFEAITGLEGYQNHDYEEYGAEARLRFPRMLAPFISPAMRRNSSATSELAFSYNLQNRPEFHRRVFSALWRYRWAETGTKRQWKFDLVDLNYIHMPWISETFKHDYLDSSDNRNAILRYNYEDIFVMKIGLGMTYTSLADVLKVNVETSGNLLNGLSSLCSFSKNKDGQYTLFNIAYAQYVKADVDASHIFKLGARSELVLHGAMGVAYPYGNSTVLPFEKRYFSGGANSVRGWSVRGLGPGKFKGTDGRIDFINQTGDVKLDLNAEFRAPLFWKFSWAAFIDAGNIWTLREYAEQPGGQFHLGDFYKEIAVAYGLGLRMNFGYFILRFDCGMKAVNPAYTTTREHYPLLHPDLSRDFRFHFAVGLPF